MNKLALFGDGGHARVVADAAQLQGFFNEVHFYCDFTDSKYQKTISVHDARQLADRIGDYSGLLIAIGNNQKRDELYRFHCQQGSPLVSVIHPRAVIASDVQLGIGSVVMANAVINPNARIGANTIVNTGSIVEHDCDVGESVHISPGVAIGGGVKLGNRTWIGLGANVKHGVSISEDVVIGAGATVVHSITEPGIYVGLPARRLK